MKALHPYLTFPGTAEAAFTLYRTVFGGEFAVLMRFGEGPGGENVPAADRGKVMHVALPLPNGGVLMASDTCATQVTPLVVGDNVGLSIAAESEAEVTRLFTALSEGGTVKMKPEKTFWGAYFAMCTDRFGIHWLFNYDYPK